MKSSVPCRHDFIASQWMIFLPFLLDPPLPPFLVIGSIHKNSMPRPFRSDVSLPARHRHSTPFDAFSKGSYFSGSSFFLCSFSYFVRTLGTRSGPPLAKPPCSLPHTSLACSLSSFVPRLLCPTNLKSLCVWQIELYFSRSIFQWRFFLCSKFPSPCA